MTAVTSHQCLPELIDQMPQGEANCKDMVLRLCGHPVRYSIYATLRVSYHATNVHVATLSIFKELPMSTFLYLYFDLECGYFQVAIKTNL